MGTVLPSFPKVWNVGHPSVKELFQGEVLVQEKVDGSQFSFGVNDVDGLCFKSHHQDIAGDAGQFGKAMVAIAALHQEFGLTPGWVYRGEYVPTPKANKLEYERCPANYVILFDISCGPQRYVREDQLWAEGLRLGLEVVLTDFPGTIESPDQLRALLKRESILGKAQIEGIVIKNYERYHLQTGDVLMGKFVSEAFREIADVKYRTSNADVVATLAAGLGTQRRWEKAVEFLRDGGVLQSAPQDIGALIRRVQADIETECEATIKDTLYAWALPQLRRKVVGGLPEWYKQRLLEGAFKEETHVETVGPGLQQVGTPGLQQGEAAAAIGGTSALPGSGTGQAAPYGTSGVDCG